jgi:hypothetical protein
MFDTFKQNHGGLGPLKVATAAAHGIDWHTIAAAQKQWTATFDAIASDSSLPENFRRQAATIRTGKYPVSHALEILNNIQEQASGIKGINSGVDRLSNQLSDLRTRATTQDDKAQLDVMDTQLSMYHDFATSGDPKLRDVGIAGLSNTASTMQTFSTTNEAQTIAKQAADDLAKQKYGEQNWSRFQNLNTDARAQNATFIQQQGAMDRVREIANLPRSGAGDRAIVMNALQIIRPGAIVRGDGSDLDNLDGVPDILKTLYSRAFKDGQLLTGEDYTSLFNVTAAAYKAGRAEQYDRNSAITKAAKAAGLPEELISPLIQPLGTELETKNDIAASVTPQKVPASRLDVNPQSTAPDTPARMAGDSIRDALFDDLGTNDLMRGLFNRKNPQQEPYNPYPRTGIINRNTDEFK